MDILLFSVAVTAFFFFVIGVPLLFDAFGKWVCDKIVLHYAEKDLGKVEDFMKEFPM